MPYADPEAQRKFQREWRARNRATWFRKHGPCTRCGSWKNLEAHHVNRKAKVDHRVWSWSPARREAELAKCKVLCRSCHQRETSKERRDRTYKHGGERMYRAAGCRCWRCRAWKRGRNKQDRELGWRE